MTKERLDKLVKYVISRLTTAVEGLTAIQAEQVIATTMNEYKDGGIIEGYTLERLPNFELLDIVLCGNLRLDMGEGMHRVYRISIRTYYER